MKFRQNVILAAVGATLWSVAAVAQDDCTFVLDNQCTATDVDSVTFSDGTWFINTTDAGASLVLSQQPPGDQPSDPPQPPPTPVTPPPVNPPPPSQPPPADSCDGGDSARVVTNWSSEFGDLFPGPTYATNKFVSAPDGAGKSIRFRTPSDFTGGGSIGNIFMPGEPSRQRASISPCQADWDVPEDCRWEGSGNSSSIFWTLGEVVDGACTLQPNTVYNLNLGWTGECERCEFRLRLGSTEF